MGLSPSGCMFSFSLLFIRHNFRIVFCFIFFWTCRNIWGTDAVPSSAGPSQPLHLLTVWGGSRGHWTPWDSNPIVIGLGKTCSGVASAPGPSPEGCATNLWQTWWALAEAVPQIRSSVVQERALLGAAQPSWVRGCWCSRERELGTHLVGAARGLWRLLWIFLVETKLRRGARCI